MSDETTFEFAPPGKYTVKPNYTMIFSNDKGVVGKLDFNGPALVFTGDVDESAKLFFDAVEKWFHGRIEKAYENGFVAGMKKSQESKVTQLIEAQLKEKRVWVDLTDDEIDKAIEAKLKEKNGG